MGKPTKSERDQIIIAPTVYKANRIEPRTEPCGTPQYKVSDEEAKLLIETVKLLSERYKENHYRTEPEMPTHCLSLSTKIR